MAEPKEEKRWSKFAITYNADQEYVAGRTILNTIINRLDEEQDLGEVVEFGCGAGYFTKEIAKNAKEVIATDLSDEMLEMAKKQLKEFKNITFQKADCEEAPFPSRKFDVVFMANLIHVIKNRSKALHESYRILKEGGMLLIVDFTCYGVSWVEKMKMNIRYLMKWGIPPNYERGSLSPTELVSLVESVGFKIEEIFTIKNKSNALYLKAKKK